MNAQKLSKRLETVASFVPTGAIVADIGSDHAYLPCYLVHKGIAARAVAGEVVKGPYESAVKQVRTEGLTDKITVRMADGLAAVEETDEITAVTIAGMGGPLIVSILEKHPQALKSVTRLILQPNIHAKAIREWAMENGWAIQDEVILEEDGKIYEVLVLQRGEMKLNEAQTLLGPKLMETKVPVFIEKWLREIANWQRVQQAISEAEKTPDNQEKYEQLTHYIKMVQEAIA
ncbi:predicted SAM-dependent methyltransferase [Solibacillus silvestris StLB046]|uniref:Predicted SAM-dependent methyltransferase n=1 Tax=Solibacillus silvestris (strain StLB046) TaxID=1002809 RepID=F2F1U1_SOLSS|nr:tRNA (adenine(22)-N(1))-methyltransferase TrmK [Solibacillus silvestris]BAK17274.1 predicted SAM-dependent methyltransferase [Solibacillus silvestris StLB046]